ncbi:MAG TPA: asparagine synthase-related protein [Allosphingosinicella sp.]|jgi:asparagine synthase (glutamine-hydrolysing)
MLQAQAIYGSTAPSTWSDNGIAIGRRLFALLPEDRFQLGLITGEGGTSALAADVRLDNREELCEGLGMSAAEARECSDALLLLKALERWGDSALQRVSGPFAFAFWRGRQRELILARDFMGGRPLHYALSRGLIAFSSMPKGLHSLPEFPPAADRIAAADFLALMPETGPESYFENIKRVRPGEVLRISAEGRLTSGRYWQPALEPLRFKRSEDYADALRQHMNRGVAAQLRGAGGVVAAHLSAGLDSSTVAATAARNLRSSGGKVVAYTSVPSPNYGGQSSDSLEDEGPIAAKVAELHANMEHVLIRPDGRSPLACLDRNFFLYERPVLNLCNTVWNDTILDDVKKRGIGVLLTGMRGNTSFSFDGMPLLTQLMMRGHLLSLGREAWQLFRHGTRLGTIAAQTVGPFVPRPMWRAIARARGRSRSLTSYTALNGATSERVKERAAQRALDTTYRPRRDALEARLWMLSRVDLGNYRQGWLGGWGVDVRDPTSDRHLIEFCLRVPLDQYLRNGTTRFLARTAFTDRLPAEVTSERRKGYQAADWFETLSAAKGDVASELDRILACSEAVEALDSDKLRRLVDNWPQADPRNRTAVDNYRLALLRGISGGHFVRKASGSNA